MTIHGAAVPGENLGNFRRAHARLHPVRAIDPPARGCTGASFRVACRGVRQAHAWSLWPAFGLIGPGIPGDQFRPDVFRVVSLFHWVFPTVLTQKESLK